jgi:hypothetical protein
MSINLVTPAATSEQRRVLWQGVAVGRTFSPRMTDEERSDYVDRTTAALLAYFPPPTGKPAGGR